MMLKSCKKVRSNTIQMKQFKKNTLFDIKIRKLSILKSSLKIVKVPSISTFSISILKIKVKDEIFLQVL